MLTGSVSRTSSRKAARQQDDASARSGLLSGSTFPVARTWSERDRRIIEDMAQDHRTFDLARKYGCRPGRISQKREQYHKDWDRFNGEPVVA